MSATPADAEDIAEVFIDARRAMTYLPHGAYSDGQTAAFFRGLIENPDKLVIKAEVDNGGIAGFGVFGEGHVDHLYVRPAYQRRGIGSQLIRAAQARFRHLEGWAFEKNTDALKLYERHGFKVVERTDGSRNEEGEPDVRIVWASS
jgi:ribosomal protein S18 acetylase RimI-like enzyme